MNSVEVIKKTRASSQKVWNAWSDRFQLKEARKSGTHQTGQVVSEKGKKVPFKIVQIDSGRSFTTIWHAFFTKLVFFYEVLPIPGGSSIRCKVSFRGLFSLPVGWFLKGKIRNTISEYLQKFARDIER